MKNRYKHYDTGKKQGTCRYFDMYTHFDIMVKMQDKYYHYDAGKIHKEVSSSRNRCCYNVTATSLKHVCAFFPPHTGKDSVKVKYASAVLIVG